MDLKIFKILEEQNIICFSGKLNLLKSNSKELIGSISFYEGEIVNASLNRLTELKALMNIIVFSNKEEVDYVIEPELILTSVQRIDYPLGVLKVKAIHYLEEYEKSVGNRPPDDLKLIPKVDFILNGGDVTPSEYSLLSTMVEFNRVEDIYIHNSMLEFEITNALITLRKKEAIKVVETK